MTRSVSRTRDYLTIEENYEGQTETGDNGTEHSNNKNKQSPLKQKLAADSQSQQAYFSKFMEDKTIDFDKLSDLEHAASGEPTEPRAKPKCSKTHQHSPSGPSVGDRTSPDAVAETLQHVTQAITIRKTSFEHPFGRITKSPVDRGTLHPGKVEKATNKQYTISNAFRPKEFRKHALSPPNSTLYKASSVLKPLPGHPIG